MSAWDDDLGRELRESPLPAHRPGYFERIRRLLPATEGARPAGGAGTLAGSCPEAPADAGRQPAQPPSPTLWRRVRGVAALAAVAGVTAALVSLGGLPGLRQSGPATATAGRVLDRVERALSSLETVSGDVVEYGTTRGRPYSRRLGSFVFTAAGDFRIENAATGVVTAYDARSRTARRSVSENGRVLYTETLRGLPDAGPFFTPVMGVPQVLDRSVAAYARAVIASIGPEVPVLPVEYEGRRAWSLSVPERLKGDDTPGTLRIVVDAVSGYPLVVEHWSPDGDVHGTRVEGLRVGGSLPQRSLLLTAGSGERLLPSDLRFRRSTLAAAARLGASSGGRAAAGAGRLAGGGFRLYMPTWLPGGYRLRGVTTAVDAALYGPALPSRPGHPASLTAVLTYARGFDRFCVICRWRATNPPGSDDPFAENSAAERSAQRVRLSYGALRGRVGELVLGAGDWPHLYVTTGRQRTLSVSVAGDLTPEELQHVAESLQPVVR